MAGPAGRRGRLLIVLDSPDFFFTHRRELALAACEAGWEVHVATGPGAAASRIAALGLAHHPVPFRRGGVDPRGDLRSFAVLLGLVRRIRPDVVNPSTLKPVIWGCLAARIGGAGRVGRVANITGLGYVFIAEGARARLLRGIVGALYRLALGGGRLRIAFENETDRETIAGLGVPAARQQGVVIPGSGVDLDRFRATPEPAGPPVVVLPARLLLHKGLREFVEAARRLRAAGVEAQFLAVGDPDPANPARVPEAELAAWRAEGAVEFPGHLADMPEVLAGAHIVALPSYREGMPRALNEAAAAGRAVVTTDTPGCRDAVDPGRSGLLVPVGDAGALAEALGALIADGERRRAMGTAGRALAERRFDLRKVIAAQLALCDTVRR